MTAGTVNTMDNGIKVDVDWPDRWHHIDKFLERTGPFCDPSFTPGDDVS